MSDGEFEEYLGGEFEHIMESVSPQSRRQLVNFSIKVMDEMKTVFKCERCGACCVQSEGIELEATDIKGMSRILKITPEDFEAKHVTVADDKKIMMADKKCDFLRPDNRCSVYSVRPNFCKKYPCGSDKVRAMIMISMYLVATGARTIPIKTGCPALSKAEKDIDMSIRKYAQSVRIL
ncbi:MAG: YkgJ family cysteine cluster protein [Candidatus Methanoplasma sp.]|jgi:Fe-S-cluster containining protein|nr:YkgJ family cysteine cluster protein [Candidatus Methanoplasma sp.]